MTDRIDAFGPSIDQLTWRHLSIVSYSVIGADRVCARARVFMPVCVRAREAGEENELLLKVWGYRMIRIAFYGQQTFIFTDNS